MSKPLDDGGPAFPLERPYTAEYRGMSLLDYFAGQALVGLIGRNWDHVGDNRAVIRAWAESAYFVAENMLAARRRSEPEGE